MFAVLESLPKNRAIAIGLLAFGLLAGVGPAASLCQSAASHSRTRSERAKPEKQFSYLSSDLGVQFSYPSRFKLVPVSPVPAPAEAAYRWKAAGAPHGLGTGAPACEQACTIRVYAGGFSLATMYAGFTKKDGKWVPPGSWNGHGYSATQFEAPKLITGKGWKGLAETFHGNLRSTSGKDLGVARGVTIVAGNDETASIVLSFFPAKGTDELRKSILASLTFFSPKGIDTSVTRLFRNEKLGVEFKYPAAYKLSAMKPFSPPGAVSASLPVEAAYELKPPLPPCCAGVGGFPFSTQYYIFFLPLDFLSAAKGLGFTKNAQGEWTYKDVGEIDKAKKVSGDGWKGLRMTYNFRLYPAASALEQAQGLSSGSGYLGASEGEKTLVSAGGNRSVVLEFDPQEKDLRDAILNSLRFLKPEGVQTPHQTQHK